MPDPALASTALPLLVTGAAALGAALGVVAEILSRRALPHLAGPSRLANRTATALGTGALCALLAWRFGLSMELAAFMALVIIGVQLARIDVIHHLLPNRLVTSLLGAGLALLAAASAASGDWGQMVRGIVGTVILFFFYFILALISPKGIGMGDVKLSAPLGLYLGYLGWSQLFYGGALGFVAGGVASLVLVLKNRGNKPQEVAYGPSMLAAALAVILLSA